MTKTSSNPDPTSIFQSLQTPYIVLAANDPDFTIIEENEAQANVAMVSCGDVLSKPFWSAYSGCFDKFKKNPQWLKIWM